MTSDYTELLKAIHTSDKSNAERFARMENQIDETVNGRFNENERRIGLNEVDIKELKTEKSKWFDVVMQSLVIAILGYLLVQAGLK